MFHLSLMNYSNESSFTLVLITAQRPLSFLITMTNTQEKHEGETYISSVWIPVQIRSSAPGPCDWGGVEQHSSAGGGGSKQVIVTAGVAAQPPCRSPYSIQVTNPWMVLYTCRCGSTSSLTLLEMAGIQNLTKTPRGVFYSFPRCFSIQSRWWQ